MSLVTPLFASCENKRLATPLATTVYGISMGRMPLRYIYGRLGFSVWLSHLNRSVRPSGNVRKLLCRLMAVLELSWTCPNI